MNNDMLHNGTDIGSWFYILCKRVHGKVGPTLTRWPVVMLTPFFCKARGHNLYMYVVCCYTFPRKCGRSTLRIGAKQRVNIMLKVVTLSGVCILPWSVVSSYVVQ